MTDEPAGYQIVYGNYFPREVIATFKTEKEAEEYVARWAGVAPWEIEPFYFETTDQHLAEQK